MNYSVGGAAAPFVSAGGVAGADGAGPRIRSGPARLMRETFLPAGPTVGASAVPTEMRSASGLPVVRTGAFALAGTSKLWPAWSTPSLRTAAPSLTEIQTGSLAVRTTGPVAAGCGAAAGTDAASPATGFA